MKDIVKIEKKKILGIFKSAICIGLNEKQYVFGTFENRDLAFSVITAYWRNVCPSNSIEDQLEEQEQLFNEEEEEKDCETKEKENNDFEVKNVVKKSKRNE